MTFTPPTPAAQPPATVARPRWGVQTGFLQRNQPAFWLFVVLVALAGLVVFTRMMAGLADYPVGWIFGALMLVIYVAPVALAIYFLDLFEREPISLLVASFLWGAVVVFALSIETNTALIVAIAKLAGVNFAQTWGMAIVPPIIEETFKFLGVVTIYLLARNEIDDLLDGFIYGAMIGLGFAAVEHMHFFMDAIGGTGGRDQLGPVLGSFFLRVVLFGAYGHATLTGITGIGLAYYVT
ncbi:MAG: PrsW family intramembrane metalloprotease, partial [Chloroflexota bacterium]|nr:PrsW family intramembrane metalloprotease [Chloroflexota bacterium]